MNRSLPTSLRKAFALLALTTATILLPTSCQRSSSSTTAESSDSLSTEALADFAHVVTFEHAQRISLENHPDYKLLTIQHPDEAKELARYILYPRGNQRPSIPADAYIEVPIRSIACLSTSQIGALPLLSSLDKLTGVGDPEYIYNAEVQRRLKEKQIQVIAQGMSKNYEALAALRPDVLLTSFVSEDTQESELQKAGVSVLLDYEWKEESLLGRAEWLKFFGLLLGKNVLAEEQFAKIKQDYQQTTSLLKGQTPARPALYGMDYQGAWTLPGEKSYIADLLGSAGIQIETSPGVVSGKTVPLEQILAGHRADSLWICMPPNGITSVSDFAALNARYADFTAVRSGRILAPNKRVSTTAANDYWETGVYEPNIQVKDLLYLTRPELLPAYQPKYWLALSH